MNTEEVRFPQSLKRRDESTRMVMKNAFLLSTLYGLYGSGQIQDVMALKSDELDLEVPSDFLGLRLKEVSVGDGTLLVVQGIAKEADPILSRVAKPGMVVVAIGDVTVEGYSGKEVVRIFKSMSKPTKLTLRDPSMFLNLLDSKTTNSSTTVDIGSNSVIETTVNYLSNETLRVERRLVSYSSSPMSLHLKFVL
jgi:hypothetical protein